MKGFNIFAPIARKTLTTILKWFFVLSIVFTYGGGTSLLQGVAWATMFSKEIVTADSLEESIQNTFDGKKPCVLCKVAAELRGQEHPTDAPAEKPSSSKESQASTDKEKTSRGLPDPFRSLPSSMLSCVGDTDVSPLSSITLSIDVPPPRLA